MVGFAVVKKYVSGRAPTNHIKVPFRFELPVLVVLDMSETLFFKYSSTIKKNSITHTHAHTHIHQNNTHSNTQGKSQNNLSRIFLCNSPLISSDNFGAFSLRVGERESLYETLGNKAVRLGKQLGPYFRNIKELILTVKQKKEKQRL